MIFQFSLSLSLLVSKMLEMTVLDDCALNRIGKKLFEPQHFKGFKESDTTGMFVQQRSESFFYLVMNSIRVSVDCTER